MSELVAALLGIVAGGLLTGGVDIYLADRERRMSSRAAARLILADYTRAEHALGVASGEGEWWPDHADAMVAAEDWQRYREQLAGGIPPHHFTTIDGAFTQLAWVRGERARGASFADCRVDVEAARVALVRAETAIVKASKGWRGARKEMRDIAAIEDDSAPTPNDDDR